MKKIKLLTNYASPEKCVSTNQVANFEDAEADQLISLGYAELIEVIAEAEVIEVKKVLDVKKEDQKDDHKDDQKVDESNAQAKPLETADLKPAEQKEVELKRKELFKK